MMRSMMETSTILILKNCKSGLTERSTSGNMDHALLDPNRTADPLPT